MSKKYYRQCRMKKKIGEERYKLHTAWIPEKFAQQGQFIKLKWEDGTWENGWEIVGVGDTKKEEKDLVNEERDYKNQRKASDI
jgi:hypothetical protein